MQLLNNQLIHEIKISYTFIFVLQVRYLFDLFLKQLNFLPILWTIGITDIVSFLWAKKFRIKNARKDQAYNFWYCQHSWLLLLWIELLEVKETVSIATRSDPYVDRGWHWVWISITPKLHKSVIPLIISSGFMCITTRKKTWLEIMKV